MIKVLFYAAFAASIATFSNAECANACNGHGKCTSYDMCVCNRNWQANDCSERVCQFGLAHVDTPKGDLDNSGEIEGPDDILVQNSFVYPFGTTEKFPRMQNTDLADLANSAHYYMECSNKGTCNRETGTCECFDGYDGAACQRASCPGYPESCSGHGVCKTIRQLANADYGNIYQLWDKDATMGCECDAGFFGPDCSLRECKYGVDPLYLDDSATIKYSTYNFAVVTTAATADFTDGMDDPGDGYFAIRFYDMHGEDWLTAPIREDASCADVINALNDLPNDVIPAMTTSHCTKVTGTAAKPLDPSSAWNGAVDNYYTPARNIELPMAFWTEEFPTRSSWNKTDSGFDLSGSVYRIHFFNNPGKFREPEIEIYLDGKRPSISSPGGTTITKVWTDGQAGESIDYVADHCDGVTVTIAADDVATYLDGLTLTETQLLKACLGPSDFDTANNVDVYEWDFGNESYPHLIKLVRTVTQIDDGGYYAAIVFANNRFELLNPFRPHDDQFTNNYEVYTTKGTLALTSGFTEAVFGFAEHEVYMTNITHDAMDSDANPFNGDVSCETTDNNGVKFQYINHCLNKGDLFTMLTFSNTTYNPRHINLYTAEKLFQKQPKYAVDEWKPVIGNPDDADAELRFKQFTIVTDIATNWANSKTPWKEATFNIYKFFPHIESQYEYVAQCSNRGLCNEEEGLCECFSGYTGDSCSDQNSLAV